MCSVYPYFLETTMIALVSTIFLIAFACITWRRFEHGLFLLFLLLPTYLIRFHTGPLPTTLLELMLWIVFAIFIANAVRRSEFDVQWWSLHNLLQKNRLLALGTIFFLVAATVAVFVSSDLRAAAGEWKAFYVEPVILFLLLAAYLRDKKQITQQLILALILSGLAVSAYAIMQKLAGGWTVPEAFWQSGRVTAWYGFPNGVGLFLTPLIPLALLLIKTAYDRVIARNDSDAAISRLLRCARNDAGIVIPAFLFLICAPLAVLFAKSTGGLVGIAGGIGILLLLWKRTRWPALAAGVIGILIVLLLPQLDNIKTELLARDRSGQIRRAIWSETLVFLEDNTLLGAGLASYTQRIAPYHGQVNGENIEIFHHPHNLFLTMWVNLGLLGAAGFVMLILWFYQNAQYKKESMFVVACMTAILITGLVDSPYIKNDLSIFFWFVLALGTVYGQTAQNHVE